MGLVLTPQFRLRLTNLKVLLLGDIVMSYCPQRTVFPSSVQLNHWILILLFDFFHPIANVRSFFLFRSLPKMEFILLITFHVNRFITQGTNILIKGRM